MEETAIILGTIACATKTLQHCQSQVGSLQRCSCIWKTHPWCASTMEQCTKGTSVPPLLAFGKCKREKHVLVEHLLLLLIDINTRYKMTKIIVAQWCWIWWGEQDAPFIMCRADMASGACFWWQGVLSNKKSPWAQPLVRPSKMSMALSTCCRRSSALKYLWRTMFAPPRTWPWERARDRGIPRDLPTPRMARDRGN